MKIMCVGSNYSFNKNQQFKGSYINPTKKGLLPIVLAGGLLASQPAIAGDTSNFYPENEYSIPSGEMPIKFLKSMLIGIAVVYGLAWGINKMNDNEGNKNI